VVTQLCLGTVLPDFDILASKDLGKIVFTLLVFAALGIFVAQQPLEFRLAWRVRNFLFLWSTRGLTIFAKYFGIFFVLHALLLAVFYWCGVAQLHADVTCTLKTWGQLLFGFGATFMLAYTEEVMFRGTVFPYLVQFLRPIVAVFFTALAFMTVHFLPNPLGQVWRDPAIALGLFLLGFMLNLIFIAAETMYANIGAHAGLVFVKVILRKVRFLTIAAAPSLPWFLHHDLRQAPLIYLLFTCVIVGLVVWQHKKLFSNKIV
jgi:membrane protease YdiL (CAAX protease family)